MILATLNSRNLLFSENAQAIYELDDFSAHVWRSITLGMSQAEMIQELTEAGVEYTAARNAVALSVQKLRAIEPRGVVPAVLSSNLRLERRFPATLELAGIAVRLNLCPALLAEVDAAFRDLKCDLPYSHLELSASVMDGQVELRSNGVAPWRCERPQFLPEIKAWLIESVLKFATHELALHAAALVRGGKALLLLGSPGTGKTTLGAYLIRSGFKLAADDVVLLRDGGFVEGLPMPLTVKEGAWPMLAELFPELEGQSIYCRPDGIRVKYLPNEHFAHKGPCDVRYVIQLDRQEGGGGTLNAVSSLIVLEALIAEADARGSRLTARGFTALVSALESAHCFRLTYSDLPAAAAAVASLYS